MRTLTLVLDSNQGVGTANRFTVNLNESIRGCVHSQLRQVILTGMAPAADYVYVRSGKLGSNIISSQGFGAFDVIPVSDPFRYERYSAQPNLSEFECGRLLNTIDIALVNPDNTPVALMSSVVISNPYLFSVVYRTSFTDGTFDERSIPVVIPLGTYTTAALATAIQKELPPTEMPNLEFSASFPSNLRLRMDWISPPSDTIHVTGSLFKSFGLSAVYDTIPSLTSTTFPVSLPTGTYTKTEFLTALGNALAPSVAAIANVSSSAALQVSLNPSNHLVINLNWASLSQKGKTVIQNPLLFNGIDVVATFNNLPTLSSPVTPVKIPAGAYTTDKLVAAVQDALSLTAASITETFNHGEFLVSVSPSNDLLIQLNWVCSSYGDAVTLPTLRVINDVVITAQFSDGTTRSTSTTPAAHIPAGSYTMTQLEDAITRSLAPISTALVASSNYNSAVFSTSIVNDIVTVNLDWVCSSYSDSVTVNATSFTVTLVVTDQSIYTDTTGGVYNSQPNSVGPDAGSFPTRVSIPSGNYSQGEIFTLIQNQLASGPYNVSIVSGNITIAVNGTFQYTHQGVTNGLQPPINCGFFLTQRNSVISITFDTGANATDLALLGLNPSNTYASVSPTIPPNTDVPIRNFTASVSFALCPSFPPSLTSIAGVMNFADGDYTVLGLPPPSTPLNSSNVSFSASTLQQRCSWTFPSAVLFPTLANVQANLQLPVGSAWSVAPPVVTQATQNQYAFVWTIPLSFPTLVSASAALTYDGEGSMNSAVGLASSAGVQTLAATATQLAAGQEQFTWTFPNPLSFPVLSNVSASLEGCSSEIGGTAAVLNGTPTVFTAQQRRFTFDFPNPPVATNESKAMVVVELTISPP